MNKCIIIIQVLLPNSSNSANSANSTNSTNSTTMSSEVVYTDGACSGNGTPGATGGLGFYIAKSALMGNNLKFNQKGYQTTVDFGTKKETFYVTNIRMEGLAIISVLSLYEELLINNYDRDIAPIDRLNSLTPYDVSKMKFTYEPTELKAANTLDHGTEIEIVTDSQFWINVVTAWMPTWIRKNIAMTKKNPDILLMFQYYLQRLNQNNIKVKFTHVKSHQRANRTFHADGNDVADVLATSACGNPTLAYYQQN